MARKFTVNSKFITGWFITSQADRAAVWVARCWKQQGGLCLSWAWVKVWQDKSSWAGSRGCAGGARQHQDRSLPTRALSAFPVPQAGRRQLGEGWKAWGPLEAFALTLLTSAGLGHTLKGFAEQGGFLNQSLSEDPNNLCCSQRSATVMEWTKVAS